MVKVSVGIVGMVMMMVGMVGRLKLVGLCTKAGRLTAHGNFFPKWKKIPETTPCKMHNIHVIMYIIT